MCQLSIFLHISLAISTILSANNSFRKKVDHFIWTPIAHCLAIVMVPTVHRFGHIFLNKLLDNNLAMNWTPWSLIELMENPVLSQVILYFSFMRATRIESFSLPTKNEIRLSLAFGNPVIAERNSRQVKYGYPTTKNPHDNRPTIASQMN